jgi:hypothetical protein
MPTWLYFSKPQNKSYHNLCNDKKLITPGICSLLGLGLNFCSQPLRTSDWDEERFERDIFTKYFFSGSPNKVIPKLFIRSAWKPSPNDISLELRQRVENFTSNAKILYRPKRSSSNLLPYQQAMLQTLKDNNHLIILKSDKNLGPVVMERELYINRALEEHLQNANTYRQLTTEMGDGRVKSIIRMITNFNECFLQQRHHSDYKYIARSLEVPDPYSYFYLLAKVHKSPWKTRPIISASGSITYGLAKWVDVQLQSINKLLPFVIKSSYELSLTLRKFSTLKENSRFFTMDAVSMYTNIDTHHALTSIKNFLSTTDYATRANVDVDALMRALDIVMKNNIFKFGDTTWLQMTGTAMGTPPAPTYATLYFAIHELKIIHRYPELNFYGRYLDDCLCIWTPMSHDDANIWQCFQDDFNDYGKLTWEFTPRSTTINFLDLDITINENYQISTSIYEKALNLYLYLPPHSSHSPGVLKGLIFGMIQRITRLTSDSNNVKITLKKFYLRLRRRGYSKEILVPLFKTGLDTTRIAKSTENVETLYFHVPFHPRSTPSSDIQQLFRNTMLNPPGATPLPSLPTRHQTTFNVQRLTVAYSRTSNLGNMLAPRRLITSPSTAVSTFICNN